MNVEVVIDNPQAIDNRPFNLYLTISLFHKSTQKRADMQEFCLAHLLL